MYVDHTGRQFEQFKEMCKFWGMPTSTVWSRLSRGATIEKALTAPKQPKTHGLIDHTGRSFDTLDEMLHEYGINISNYYQRRARGWTLEKILTTPIDYEKGRKMHVAENRKITERKNITLECPNFETAFNYFSKILQRAPKRIKIQFKAMDVKKIIKEFCDFWEQRFWEHNGKQIMWRTQLWMFVYEKSLYPDLGMHRVGFSGNDFAE